MDYFIWNADPILVSFWAVKIRWYGLMFALAFICSHLVMGWIYKREGKSTEELDDLLWYMAVSIIVGARLGHCLFYDPGFYLSHPLKILYIWEGGLASHGGIIGIILGLYLFQRRVKESFFWFLDRMAVVCALGAGFVRTGNFFNSEIVGIPTSVPWAIIFKRVDWLPRHPVQLYEALSYFLIFLFLLQLYRKCADIFRPGVLFAVSLVCIFSVRFGLEFFKTKQAAYANELGLSTGQMLSIPFLIIGIGYILFSIFNKQTEP